MSDNRVEIRYKAADVTTTQRSRILRSRQFVLLLGVWGLGIVFVALHVLLPQWFIFIPGASWAMVWQIGVVYIASIVLLLFVVPWFSFTFTRFWRMALIFQWNSRTLRLGLVGKSGGLKLEWRQVLKVEETSRAFVIYYGDFTKHFILPKACFSEGAEARFRVQVERWKAARNAPAMPTAISEEDDAEKEESS